MNVSDTCNAAADLIEVRGWVGTGGRGWDHDQDGPLCLEGALQAALGMHGGIAVSVVNNCPAGRAVREYLGMRPHFAWNETPALFMWNDEARYDAAGQLVPVRTAEHVIATLRAVAVIHAAQDESAETRTVEAVSA